MTEPGENRPDQAEVETNEDIRPIRRALLSVFDKTGIVEFGRALHEQGVELVSTGGTARSLEEAGLPVTTVEAITEFPEMLEGRVKTLHPKIFAGLLADRDKQEHLDTIAAHEIDGIDLVCVNLYPFEDTVAATDDARAIIEKIDVGGPSMLRAGAKNHSAVVSVSNPELYDLILADLREHGGSTESTRIICAADVFERSAAYETAIREWFADYRDQRVES